MKKESVKIILAMLMFCTLFSSVQVFGQSKYPNKPIEVIVPYAPGGGLDLGVRFFTDKWAEFLGQPVVVINKPGAGGYVGGKMGANATRESSK